MDIEYSIVPLDKMHPTDVAGYWCALEKAGLVKMRLCGVIDPKPKDIGRMLTLNRRNCYYLTTPDGRTVAEFMFGKQLGRSVQIHFSMHPDNTPQESMHYARTATDTVLNDWKKDGLPILDSIFGITPIKNRAACAFIQRVGFKKVGILPGGAPFCGEEGDGLITIKTRRGYNGVGQ